MKTASELSLLVLMVLGVSSMATADEPPRRNLLTHGTDRMFWIAEIVPVEHEGQTQHHTHIRSREAGAADRWQTFEPLRMRVVDLTNRGPELVVVLENGNWMFVWADGSRPGQPLPGRALAMAASRNELWALAEVRGGLEALDSGAPAQRELAPHPDELPPRIVLLRLDRSTWIPVAELPDAAQSSADAAPQQFSLAVFEDETFVVAAVAGEVRGLSWSAEELWREHALPLAAAPQRFDLITAPQRLLLWTWSSGERVGLLRWNDGWSEFVAVQAPPELLDAEPAMAVAVERLRLLLRADGRLYEQLLEWDGTALGEPVELTLPRPVVDPAVGYWINVALLAVLVLAMLGAFHRRRAMAEAMARSERLSLAPLGVRLLAGIVDATPLLVALLITAGRVSDPNELAERMVEPAFWVPMFVGVVAYFLHTTLIELAAARSIGKMIFGLRVVTLDGHRPGAAALLLRNVLRIIDLWMLVPLLLVLVSPLRQRVGDIAAATLVVSGPARDEDAGEQEKQEYAIQSRDDRE